MERSRSGGGGGGGGGGGEVVSPCRESVFVCKRRKSCRRNLGKLHLFFLVTCKL